jgi:hypothetical protein
MYWYWCRSRKQVLSEARSRTKIMWLCNTVCPKNFYDLVGKIWLLQYMDLLQLVILVIQLDPPDPKVLDSWIRILVLFVEKGTGNSM